MFCKHCGKNIYDLEKCPFCNDGENVQMKTVEEKTIEGKAETIEEKQKNEADVKPKKEELPFASASEAVEDWSNTKKIGKAKKSLEYCLVAIIVVGVLGFLVFGFFATSLDLDIVQFFKDIGFVRGVAVLFFISFIIECIVAVLSLFDILAAKSQIEWMMEKQIDLRKIIKYGKKTDKDADLSLRVSLMMYENPSSAGLLYARFAVQVAGAIIGSFAFAWISVSVISGLYNGTEILGLSVIEAIKSVVFRFDVLVFIVLDLIFMFVPSILHGKIKKRAEENLLEKD